MSLPELSKLLGHSNLSTTEIYAETDYEMISEAVAKITNNDIPNKWESLDEDEKLRILGLKR